MRYILPTMLCVLLVGGRVSLADELSSTINMLEGAKAYSQYVRASVSTVQRMAPEQVELCLNLCDAVEQSAAQCEFLVLRANENGINPATQVAIVQQFAQFQQLAGQLQWVDAQIGRRFPH